MGKAQHEMNRDRRGLPSRWFASAVAVVAAIAATATARAAGDAEGTADAGPRCHTREDRACTLVRETDDGFWVWTQRFRVTDATGPPWSISFGPGGAVTGAAVSFVANVSIPPDRSTPNGAPILE